MLAAKGAPRTVPARGPVAGAAAAALALALSVPLILGGLTARDPAAIATGSAAFGLVAAVTVGQVATSHPHPRFGAANTLTLLRAAGAAALLGLAVTPAGLAGAAGWGAAAAAGGLLALDGVDGWLARRSGLASAFGARFDMEVDALLIVALSALAFATGRAGAWVLALGLLRYGFVALGRLRPRFAVALPPSARRRTVCVAVITVLAALLAPPLQPPLSAWLAAATLGLLVWSFALDLAWLARRPG